MKFEERILASSRIKEAKLLKPSSVAMVKPDTGVEIKKKSAYYVIRDCATLAHDYIPHKCYSSIKDPIVTLHGQFTKADIIDFVARSKSHKHTKQLLWIIFSDIYKVEADDWTPPPTPLAIADLVIDADADGEDIYGDYGYGEDDKFDSANADATIPVKPPVDLGDGEAVIAKLISVFSATKEK
jgi:hypothetical protein